MFKKLIMSTMLCFFTSQIFSNVLMQVELAVEENKSTGTFDLKDGEPAVIPLNENLCLVLHVVRKENDAIAVVLEVVGKNPETQEFELVSSSTIDTAWSTPAQFNFSDAPISLKMVAMKNDAIAEVAADEAQEAEQVEQN